MEFKADKVSVERFIAPNVTLYEALGLAADADVEEIKARTNLLRTVTSVKYSVQIGHQADEVKAHLYNKKKRKAYDKILTTAVQSAVQSALHSDLLIFLNTVTNNDGILDYDEEKDFYEIGRQKGVSHAELKVIFEKYVQENNVPRGPAPRSTPAPARPPKPSPAPSSPPPPPPSQTPNNDPPPGTMEERIRWGVIAALGATSLGALTTFVLSYALRPSFWMFVVVASVGWAINALNQQKPKQIASASVLAFLASSGNPVVSGVLLGIVGSVIVVMIAHRMRGSRGLAGTLAGIVFLCCTVSGMVRGPEFLKSPAGDIIWPIVNAQNKSMTPSRARKTSSQPIHLPDSKQAKSRPADKTTTKQTSAKTPVTKTRATTTRGMPATQPITAPAQISIQLDTKPSSAEVIIGGSSLGQKTPLEFKTPAGGALHLTFKKPGYYDFNSTLKIPSGRTSEIKKSFNLTPLPYRAVEGTWKGKFDDKPIKLIITHASSGGSFTGTGTITLNSGTQSFNLKGNYNSKTKVITFLDKSSGMVFSGTMDPGSTKSMSGSSTLPGLDLNRSWSLDKTSSSVAR